MPAWTIEGALRAVARTEPLTAAPDATVRSLLESLIARMETVGDSAVVILDPATRIPLGVLTATDLLRLIGLEDVPGDTPVAALMTAGLVTVSADAPVQQAATLMVRRNARHLVLLESDGRFYGLLAQADLYSLHASQVDALVRAITSAPDVPTLATHAAAVRHLAGKLLEKGVSAEAICHWLSTLNDLVALQAIDLVEPQFDLPIVPWCWMLFGSEGRFEQTFFTDQDNGILFVPETSLDGDALTAETERLRVAFLPFARAVNEALDDCGFPLCTGNIMASNPKWCLSLIEWQDAFKKWMQHPEPEALLNASIFFDFRCLYGPEEPVQRLRETLRQEAAQASLCLRLMAGNALEVSPPLGKWWAAFRYDDADYPDSIDLKKYGSRLFVDVARIYALAEGVVATGTVPRLRAVGERLKFPVSEISSMVDSFYVLQRLRLKHQHQLSRNDPALENRIRPDDLSEIDRHLLQESLQQARRLQQRARLRWQLN